MSRSTPRRPMTSRALLALAVVERRDVSGELHAILVEADGTLSAWSDPRRGGRAIGY